MICLGSFAFQLAKRALKKEKTLFYRIFVDNFETMSAGIIAGGAIIGLLILILETLVLK
jgi:hypothetical protein